MIWVLAALLAAGTSLCILWVSGKGAGAETDRASRAMAIYRDQLAEVARDAERGLISEQEARAAEVEIKRRMLGAEQGEAAAQLSGLKAVSVSAVLIPVAGVALYLQLGQPDMQSLPFAERGTEQQEAQELVALVTELESRLQNDPDGGELRGWELLGRTYMNMGRLRQAVTAWERAAGKAEATSATFSQFAEALIEAENGVVTPKAEAAIEQAMRLDPTNPAATFYRAIAMEQAGQTAAARELLLERIAGEGAAAPWQPTFLRTANSMGESLGLEPVGLPDFPARPGPTAEDVQAAGEMNDEERAEFIRSMVDRLATRLEDEPEDLAGWIQLARAYAVLGETENALSALRSAEPLVADRAEDDPERQLVEAGIAQFSTQ